MTIRPDLTVSELVLRHPTALAVLSAAGIDTCCGGAETLGNAAECAGLTWDELAKRLQNAGPAGEAPDAPAPHCGCGHEPA